MNLTNPSSTPQTRRGFPWSLLILIGVLLIGAIWTFLPFIRMLVVFGETNSNPVDTACQLARLAPPPGQIIRSESEVLLAGAAHVQFRADRDEIKYWIQISPGTNALTPSKKYSSPYELQFVDYDTWLKGKDDSDQLDVEAIIPGKEWFAPQIKNGVRYDVPPDNANDRGSIFIDWDTNTVWVRAEHS